MSAASKAKWRLDMDEQSQSSNESQDRRDEMRRMVSQDRFQDERLAQQIRSEARQQWDRSIDGMLALPTALTLGIASSTLSVAAFIKRGVEVFQQSTHAVRSGVEQTRRERRRIEREDDRALNSGQSARGAQA